MSIRRTDKARPAPLRTPIPGADQSLGAPRPDGEPRSPAPARCGVRNQADDLACEGVPRHRGEHSGGSPLETWPGSVARARRPADSWAPDTALGTASWLTSGDGPPAPRTAR